MVLDLNMNQWNLWQVLNFGMTAVLLFPLALSSHPFTSEICDNHDPLWDCLGVAPVKLRYLWQTTQLLSAWKNKHATSQRAKKCFFRSH